MALRDRSLGFRIAFFVLVLLPMATGVLLGFYRTYVAPLRTPAVATRR